MQQRGLRGHLLGIADRHVHRLQGAAHLLDDYLLQRLVGPLLDGLHHQIHLAVLAPQGHHHCAVHIGVGGIARHYVHGQLLIRSHLRTSQLVIEGHASHHLLGNDARRIGSTHAGRQDQHFIPYADTTVGPPVTVKSHLFFLLTPWLPGLPGVPPRCGHGHVRPCECPGRPDRCARRI